MRKIKFCLLFFLIFLTACSSIAVEKNTDQIEQEAETSSVDNKSKDEIAKKVKNYIINDQENKSEGQKIKWSKTFLEQVDIESLYEQYIDNGGLAEDVESFAEYMTLNAPIPDNWEELVKKDLYDTYGEEAVRFENLEDDLYQVYIEIDGEEVPYVVVSARTGYFHG